MHATHLTGGSVAPTYLESRSLVGSLRQNCECQVDKATEQDAHTPAPKGGQTLGSQRVFGQLVCDLVYPENSILLRKCWSHGPQLQVSTKASGAVRWSGSKGKWGFISSAVKLWGSATSPFLFQSPAIIRLQHLMFQI